MIEAEASRGELWDRSLGKTPLSDVAAACSSGVSFACLEALGRYDEALAKLGAATIFQEVGVYTDAAVYAEIERHCDFRNVSVISPSISGTVR